MSVLQFSRVPTSAGAAACHKWRKEEHCSEDSCHLSLAVQLRSLWGVRTEERRFLSVPSGLHVVQLFALFTEMEKIPLC